MLKLLLTALAALPLLALAAPPQPLTLEVQNMTCGLCPLTVKRALQQVPGVEKVQVDFERKTASVYYDPDLVQPATLIEATGNAGYPSTVQE
jgi:periplasmic mercuric ion binding protein